MILLVSMTVSAQQTISDELNKFYITKVLQGQIDSTALAECEQEQVLLDAKFQAMEMQSNEWLKQLNENTDKANQYQKANNKLTKNVRTKNVLLAVLAAITTGLILR